MRLIMRLDVRGWNFLALSCALCMNSQPYIFPQSHDELGKVAVGIRGAMWPAMHPDIPAIQLFPDKSN